ncbi:DUF3667 domain-containing protein [Pedobacter sp. Du54]|uniref:DUF3667 domain-containing protein n=1 Tax=Pedobacter anseongensis TaxID=3133439 RepID=UPI0030A7567B
MSAGKYRKENNCLNCGFHVEKHYCSSCGQPNLELNESFWQFISHSVAHYFHFDNKFFQTLVPLISKPGKVTLDYLAGKRARYINPISMYIFVSLLYFLVVYSNNHKKENENEITKSTLKRPVLDSISTPLSNAGLMNKQILAKTQQTINESFDREEFRALPFNEQTRVLHELNTKYKEQKSDSLKKLIHTFTRVHEVANDSTYAAYLSRQSKLSSAEKDNFFERYMQKRSIEIGQNGEFIQEQLEHNRPKVYFLFMPLMAFFVMLNFRKNNIRYLDHLIFTIHGMTAFFIVSIIIEPTKRFLFPDGFISVVLETALIAWVCWYLMRSLKIFYQRKTSTTIWRALFIIILYSLSLKLAETVITNIIYYVAT